MIKTYDNSFTPFSRIISKFLSKEAAGSQVDGEINAVGNYSSVAGTFFIKPPVGKIYIINKLTVHIGDTGAFHGGGYGAQSSPLTNGINIGIATGAVTSFLTSKPIKAHTEFTAYTGQAQYNTWSTGDNDYTATWDFLANGAPIVIDGDLVQLFGAILSDNFSHLAKHLFHVKGLEITK